jgi:A/G-specific adenine glycosylase
MSPQSFDKKKSGNPIKRKDTSLPPDFSLPGFAPLVEALLSWFEENMRPLPWRKSYAPYEIWISEIMLQQTRMERGSAYFTRWMHRFPTLQSVADAHPDALLKAWEGLGYYSRVRNIQNTARLLVREHGGIFPSDPAALQALPGIGEYTAGAILSIALNLPYPAVDANVERIFSRLFDIDIPVKSPAAADFIRRMASSLIPPGLARQFNQALMELGALVCGKKARCAHCPVKKFCQTQRLGIVHERPIPGKKTVYTALEIITGVLVHNGRLFLQKRLDFGVWAGLWEFPGGRLEEGETPGEGIVREYEEETEFRIAVREKLGLVRHSYTRYTIAMHCFLCAVSENSQNEPDEAGFPRPVLHAATESRWILPEELDDYTLPAGHRKLVDAWLPRLREVAKTDT